MDPLTHTLAGASLAQTRCGRVPLGTVTGVIGANLPDVDAATYFLGADVALAWPSAEIAVMGAEGAVNILYRRELKAAEDADEMRAELAREYRQRFASPYLSASKGLISDVIEPSRTRAAVALALRSLLSKRETRPPKKHGNIPL